jgi:hypothetical protein
MNPILSELLAQLLPLVLSAAVAYLAPKARAVLASRLHADRMASLEAALGRAAQLAAKDYVDGRATLKGAASGMAGYVGAHLPDTLAKLAPAEGALEAMARATLLKALAGHGVAARDA